jgi:lipid II:glycine glycyltransferase (peptidoglycan interpeptide bridge formation enzyme)
VTNISPEIKINHSDCSTNLEKISRSLDIIETLVSTGKDVKKAVKDLKDTIPKLESLVNSSGKAEMPRLTGITGDLRHIKIQHSL